MNAANGGQVKSGKSPPTPRVPSRMSEPNGLSMVTPAWMRGTSPHEMSTPKKLPHPGGSHPPFTFWQPSQISEFFHPEPYQVSVVVPVSGKHRALSPGVSPSGKDHSNVSVSLVEQPPQITMSESGSSFSATHRPPAWTAVRMSPSSGASCSTL